MQTFLPYSDFHQSARVLDDRRLGKQRVECLQIYGALTKPQYGWKNHPAVRMWKDHIFNLCVYGQVMIEEWKRRGFNNSMSFRELVIHHPITSDPPWLGDERLHASHRSNLLRKDPVHYGQFNWTESPDLPYWWPTGTATASATEPTGKLPG